MSVIACIGHLAVLEQPVQTILKNYTSVQQSESKDD